MIVKERPDAFGNVHRTMLTPGADVPRCRTLDDMTDEEKAALERQYNCRIAAPKETQDASQVDTRITMAVCARGLPYKQPGAGPTGRAGSGYARTQAKRKR